MSKNIRQNITNKIIDLLENNEAKWHQTWKNLHGREVPYNPITNKNYNGVNMLMLSLEQTDLPHNSDPRWCTYKQAIALGYHIKKGSEGTPIMFYTTSAKLMEGENTLVTLKGKTENDQFKEVIKFYTDKHPEKAQALTTAGAKFGNVGLGHKMWDLASELNQVTGEKIKFEFESGVKEYFVFNYSQMENVPELIKIDKPNADIHKEAQAILDNSEAKIFHDQINKNYYSPTDHEIHLTVPESFNSKEAYLSTALHELGHWTMGDGVQRNFVAKNGNFSDHAKEEMRAELTSVFVGAELGLNLDIQNQSAYLSHYASILKKDPNEFFLAVSDANKISDHLIDYGLEKKHAVAMTTVETEKFGKLEVANDHLFDLKEKFFTWRADQFDRTKYEDLAKTFASLKDKSFVYDEGIGKMANREISNVLNQNMSSAQEKLCPILFSEAAYGELVLEAKAATRGYSKFGMLNDIVKDIKAQDTKVTYKAVLEAATNKFNAVYNDISKAVSQTKEASVEKSNSKLGMESSKIPFNELNKHLAAENKHAEYVKTFFTEKKLPEKQFKVEINNKEQTISSGKVIEYLAHEDNPLVQKQIKETLIKLDAIDADLSPFLQKCANGVAKQAELDINDKANSKAPPQNAKAKSNDIEL